MRPAAARRRVGIRRPLDVVLEEPRIGRRPLPPVALLVLLFALLVIAGTVLLSLPIATRDGSVPDLVTALFTATSAACVTGLVVVDTATYWSPFGQAVILGLIQLGGFGFMTGSTFLLFRLVRHRSGLRDRLLVQAETGVLQLGGTAPLLRRVALFTIAVEVTGAIALAVVFVPHTADLPQAAWWGLFHSVSAFNNAGFDVIGGFRSATPFVGEPAVLLMLAALIVVGGLGFALIADVSAKRSWVRLALETKIVVVTSIALLLVGAVLFAALEWNSPATLGTLGPGDRVVNALFHSASARTAGMNAVPVDALAPATLLVLIGLMFIGGASGSPAGGIKVNTFAVLLVAIVSAGRGLASPIAFGRRIPHAVVYRALAVALLSIAVVFVTTLALAVLVDGDPIDLAFESVSALGTVGLSTGTTPGLPDPARLLLALAMFVGRLGPLTLALALTARARPVRVQPAVESLRIG